MTATAILFLGLGGFIVGRIASRVLSERAVQVLTDNEKVVLIDQLKAFRTYAGIPLLLFLLLGLLGPLYSPASTRLIAFCGAWLALSGYVIASNYYLNRRMAALSIPQSYLLAFRRAQWCSRAGFIALCVGEAAAFFGGRPW
jgi:hypothetical protein